MENADVSLERKAHFPLSPLQPIPSGHQECGRRLAGFPRSIAQHEAGPPWRGCLGRGYLPGLRANSHWCWACLHRVLTLWPLVPCSFHQLQCCLCHDSCSLGAGQNTNLIEQWLDSHIFSAEHSIGLIKQQILNQMKAVIAVQTLLCYQQLYIQQLNKFPHLTLVTGERRHRRGGGSGSNLSLCIHGSGCLEWEDAQNEMKASGCGFWLGSGFFQLKCQPWLCFYTLEALTHHDQFHLSPLCSCNQVIDS